MGSNITLVVTACNRNDLLKRTLDSFIRTNCGGAKPDAAIIIEGGGADKPDWLKNDIHYYSSNIGTVTYIRNEGRKGQIYSIDRAYSMVKTDYIFHCEEDWEFVQGGGWMTESKLLLEQYPQIIQVSLRGDTGWHTLIDKPPYTCKIAQPYWREGWGGISFNPGLRRLSDYKKIGSYGRYTTYGTTGLGHELMLSKMLLDTGYVIADLNRVIVTHTGGSCSRANDPLDPSPKILIAIPVCHSYNYGAFESSQSPHYNPAIAHNGVAYGTDIHISGKNDRISALRETWLKDVAKFPNVDYKLFYGKYPDDKTCPGTVGGLIPCDCSPKEDEVFLSCPDDYAHLPQKTISICKFALQQDYDMLYKCDDDTGVYIDRILHEALSGMWDYAGYLNGRVATGGTGYWLSKRAFKIIAEQSTSNYHWAEDVTVSNTLFHNNIQPVHLAGHRTGRQAHWYFVDGFDKTPDPDNLDTDNISAFHAVRPEDMRAWYKWKEDKATRKVQ
jgi:hypothetical protein